VSPWTTTTSVVSTLDTQSAPAPTTGPSLSILNVEHWSGVRHATRAVKPDPVRGMPQAAGDAASSACNLFPPSRRDHEACGALRICLSFVRRQHSSDVHDRDAVRTDISQHHRDVTAPRRCRSAASANVLCRSYVTQDQAERVSHRVTFDRSTTTKPMAHTFALSVRGPEALPERTQSTGTAADDPARSVTRRCRAVPRRRRPGPPAVAALRWAPALAALG